MAFALRREETEHTADLLSLVDCVAQPALKRPGRFRESCLSLLGPPDRRVAPPRLARAATRFRGGAVHGVFPRADDPAPDSPFAYTVGLSGPRFGHPEFAVFGMDPDTAQTILNDLRERIRGGQRLHAGQRIGDLLQGSYEVELVLVDDTADERAPLSVANSLYGHGGTVDALQVVLPDRHHRLPWDPGFDAGMQAMQPLLGRRAQAN